MGRFHRAVGVVVFGSAVLGAVLLGLAIALTSPSARSRPTHGALFGVWKVVYDTQAPSPRVILAAAGLALLFAAGVAILERRVSNHDRGSDVAQNLPRATKVVIPETQGQYADPVQVTTLT